MILTHLCIFFLLPIKWITICLIVLFNKISILFRLKKVNKKNQIRNQITPVIKDVEIHPKFFYSFKFYEFNVVKMENSKRNRRNLRLKLAFERFIIITMLIRYFIAIIIRRNDFAVFYGDITKDFGGLQTGFQLAIFMSTFLSLIASYFFNENPMNLKVINLMKVYNKELAPKVIGLYGQKQVEKFYQFCQISQLIYNQNMYINVPIFSSFFIIFTFVMYSSFQLIIMLFWSLIWILWMMVVVDCINRCTEWSILTFFYISLLIDQLQDGINSKIHQSKDKLLNFRVQIFIKRLNKVCIICKSFYNFWEKYLALSFLIYLICNITFTYEFFLGNQNKIIIVKFICFISSLLILFMLILIYSLISYVSFRKQSISVSFKSFDSLKLSLSTGIKV